MALASLSSQLLARKGTARPAMRPQGFGGFTSPTAPADDLGWNDMGAEPVAVVAPAPVEVPLPPVLIEREALVEEIETPRAVKSVSVATATRIGRETAHADKAAFTLRLDADRHLRLRLASAVTNFSSQALVTRALDQFLQSLPEVDALVAQLPKPKSR